MKAVAVCALALAISSPFVASAPAEQASQPGSPAAGQLDVGGAHSCALLAGAGVRCWGRGAEGQLGYASRSTIGDDESPGTAGPVSLGPGRTAKAIAAGDYHTCALLDGRTVRCWGYGLNGRLGYGSQTIIDDPASVGSVDLGPGRTATAITAGGGHTCALLDDGNVRCWGYAGNGRLGYGDANDVGDNESPGSTGPVDLGRERTAEAISAGAGHTCALLDDGNVRCWGYARDGRLGYGNTNNDVGDTETPGSIGPVNLGPGRTAKAASVGTDHTCALLDDGTVRCWGFGGNGRLGYVGTSSIGDDEAPGSAGPVDLGLGRRAKAISAGATHTCALLDDGSVRCWGYGGNGRLGYGNTSDVGDDESPGSVPPVDVGSGRTAKAISAGANHTCALLDDDRVLCWGYGATGRLGYCNANDIGDDEAPGSVSRVALLEPDPRCPGVPGSASAGAGDRGAAGADSDTAPGGAAPVDPLERQARRSRDLRRCLIQAKRAVKVSQRRARRSCVKRFARNPGKITALRARATSQTTVTLAFRAPGTDGTSPPAARAYLIRQSRRAIRGARDFARARTLCKGSCSFKVAAVATKINLTITDLRPGTTYYYALAARDNVTGKLGPRSRTVRATTR